MSYPFTKPVPRYGFRRRWGDPRTGIVGSGPGRPMRRYLTDSEVGVPQLGPGLTALGASPETPITEGIFNVGPQRGFSRGVFTPDPPWATPRYIAATPDGVSGFGAFGQTTPKCGIPELVDKIIAQFPSLSFSLSGEAKIGAQILGIPTSFSIGPSPELIKPIVYTLVGVAGEKLSMLASQGSDYIASQLAKMISGLITQKILSTDAGIPESAKPAATDIISKLVKETLASKLTGIGKIIRDCAGVPAPAADVLLAELLKQDPQQAIVKFDPGKMSEKDFRKLATAGLTTIQAEQQKCAAAGGDWFPGGAQCGVNPTTKLLENCKKPPAGYTLKRWFCVPKGTPGAIDATQAAGTTSDAIGTAVKAPSKLPLILGAAAIAALVLTR